MGRIEDNDVSYNVSHRFLVSTRSHITRRVVTPPGSQHEMSYAGVGES